MYEKVRSRIRKSEASSTTKAKLRVRARSTARTLIYCFLLKQYRGVTIENRRAVILPSLDCLIHFYKRTLINSFGGGFSLFQIALSSRIDFESPCLRNAAYSSQRRDKPSVCQGAMKS